MVNRPLTNSVQFGVEYFDQPLEGKRYLVRHSRGRHGGFRPPAMLVVRTSVSPR